MKSHTSTIEPHADGLPACPPPEVLAAVRAAAEACEALLRAGRQISVGLDARRRLRAELQDLHGETIRRLDALEVLRAAGGADMG